MIFKLPGTPRSLLQNATGMIYRRAPKVNGKVLLFLSGPFSDARKIVARSLYRGRKELLSTRTSEKNIWHRMFTVAGSEFSLACFDDNIASDVNFPFARTKINNTFDIFSYKTLITLPQYIFEDFFFT